MDSQIYVNMLITSNMKKRREYMTYSPKNYLPSNLLECDSPGILKLPKIGGIVRSVSIATFHVYFILETSSQVRASSGPLFLAISSCSVKRK